MNMVGPADMTLEEEQCRMWQLLQTQQSTNLGQNTDPNMPFTKTVWMYEREKESIGGLSELILHLQ